MELPENLNRLLYQETDIDDLFTEPDNAAGNFEKAVVILSSQEDHADNAPNAKAMNIKSPCAANNTYVNCGTQWYDPVLAGAGTLRHYIFNKTVYKETLDVLSALEKDDYAAYLIPYLKEGMHRYGHYWRYADICTVLTGLSKVLKPRNYLEIGVRRGRSMAMVVSKCPDIAIVGFDLWNKNYAGMDNPGPAFVKHEMRKINFNGELELISGNSHVTVPEYFASHPDVSFDMVTVDGDHSEKGAAEDLRTVLPHLSVGGILVFDDIVHTKHRYLLDVWLNTVKCRDQFSTFEYTELGYGVAFAVRKY